MYWDMDTLHLSNPPNSTTHLSSGNTYLEYDDDHLGEKRKKAQI
jgi:hypothetical protein